MSDLLSTETRERRRGMLRTAMGPAIAQALEEPDVVEVLANPDGHLWLDRHGSGRSDTGVILTPHEAERIIRLVASHVRAEASGASPIISAELPESGERFEGLLPPVTARTVLCDPQACGEDSSSEGLCGGGDHDADRGEGPGRGGRGGAQHPGGGRNRLRQDDARQRASCRVAVLEQRVVIIEDTRELQCAAKDTVTLRTKPGVATLADLVRSTLRLRPDRIIVGEVRGPEALDMLKAWNTGHPGGIATVHANSARAALYRLEQLVQEAVVTVPRRLIAEAIDYIVFLKGRGSGRRIDAIVEVKGLDSGGDYALVLPPGLPKRPEPV
jgi:type IV secretion system protein VirB11